MYYANAAHALRAAVTEKVHGVAYAQGKGWLTYDVKAGCPEGVPEFFVPGNGRMPLPLTEAGADVLVSIVRSILAKGHA